MLVFISWSGPRSKAVAEALENWLAQVIQAVEPWISQDMDKGVRWGDEIADRLEQSRVGIICLTKSNLESKWIHYEAGALSKSKDAYVCTLLLDVKHVDVEQPLAQFQHTTTEKEQVFKLLKTINRLVEASGERALPESRLRDVFETYWPRLEVTFKESASIQESAASPSRSDSEMLQEVLEILRNQERQLGSHLTRAFNEYIKYTTRVGAAVSEQLARSRLNLKLSTLGPPSLTADRYSEIEFIDKDGLYNYLVVVCKIGTVYILNGLRNSRSAREFLNYISEYPNLDNAGRESIKFLSALDDSYLTTIFDAAKNWMAITFKDSDDEKGSG